MAEDPTEPTEFRPASLSPIPAQAALASRQVWGPWASAGWTVLAAVVLLGTQLLTLVVYATVRVLNNPRFDLATLGSDGTLVAVATLLSVPLVLTLVTLLIRVRGWRVGPYLALPLASPRVMILATAGLILVLAVSDGLTISLGRPVVPPVMAETVLSAPLWLISLAVVGGAPIVEEVLFRGFLYRGLAESPRLGPGMAIGITAVAWALLHIQYDLYGISTIYLMGLYLGLVRHYSGSTSLTILLHGIANTAATIEAVYFAR